MIAQLPKGKQNFERIQVKAWNSKVDIEREARMQLCKMSTMTEVIQHPIAAMPDIHWGKGATVGAVIPMTRAIIPAAVGTDIGCGMIAVKTSLTEEDLPTGTPTAMDAIRLAIECAVPQGRTHNGDPKNDAGGWRGDYPSDVAEAWKKHLEPDFKKICVIEPKVEYSNNIGHLGTLGTGNHFIEICLDEEGGVWVMLHSGSRGVGNKIGTMFIERAKKDMEATVRANLPDEDLAYLREGTKDFEEYIFALHWAQKFARINRELMLHKVVEALRCVRDIRNRETFTLHNTTAVNCHHNYVEHTTLPGTNEMVYLTRKGATSAKVGELGVIPGSMGACSYIVKGKGSAESYYSCSHGAGRQFSRSETTRRFTLDEHIKATEGVSCRKDRDVLDETPMAYKPIDNVMESQRDLVEVVARLRQIVCVKG